VVAFDRTKDDGDAAFTPGSFGFTGDVMVYNDRTQTAWREPATEQFSSPLDADSLDYFIIAPVLPSGLSFFGDTRAFVSNGRKRIAQLEKISDGLTVTVRFASGEHSVRLFGYSPNEPRIRARSGSADHLNYNGATGRFTVEVFPSSDVTAEAPGGDPVQGAVVDITLIPRP
jgi:hypothetical protein